MLNWLLHGIVLCDHVMKDSFIKHVHKDRIKTYHGICNSKFPVFCGLNIIMLHLHSFFFFTLGLFVLFKRGEKSKATLVCIQKRFNLFVAARIFLLPQNQSLWPFRVYARHKIECVLCIWITKNIFPSFHIFFLVVSHLRTFKSTWIYLRYQNEKCKVTTWIMSSSESSFSHFKTSSRDFLFDDNVDFIYPHYIFHLASCDVCLF